MLFIGNPFSGLGSVFKGIGQSFGLGERRKSQEEEFMRREEAIAKALAGAFPAAQGQGPSLALEASRQAAGRAVSGATAVQAAARPGQQGLAARLAAQTQGQVAARQAGEARLTALEEQLRNRQLLMDFIARLKGADVQAGSNIAPGAGEQLAGFGSGIAAAALGGK